MIPGGNDGPFILEDYGQHLDDLFGVAEYDPENQIEFPQFVGFGWKVLEI